MKKDKPGEVKPISDVIISLLGSQFIIKEFSPYLIRKLHSPDNGPCIYRFFLFRFANKKEIRI